MLKGLEGFRVNLRVEVHAEHLGAQHVCVDSDGLLLDHVEVNDLLGSIFHALGPGRRVKGVADVDVNLRVLGEQQRGVAAHHLDLPCLPASELVLKRLNLQLAGVPSFLGVDAPDLQLLRHVVGGGNRPPELDAYALLG